MPTASSGWRGLSFITIRRNHVDQKVCRCSCFENCSLAKSIIRVFFLLSLKLRRVWVMKIQTSCEPCIVLSDEEFLSWKQKMINSISPESFMQALAVSPSLHEKLYALECSRCSVVPSDLRSPDAIFVWPGRC